MTESLCVLNTRKAEDTFGRKENKTYINMLTGFYESCLLQSLGNLLSALRANAYQSLHPEIQFLNDGANFVFAEKIVQVAEKLDNACMINDNSEQTEIHAVFEELLKEAEKLKKEIMKYSGIPYKEDNLETIVKSYSEIKPKQNRTSMGIQMDSGGRSDGCSCSGCVIF